MKLFVSFFLLSIFFPSCQGQADWYYKNWCGEGLTYLDDSQCDKIFPTVLDRDQVCPAPVLTTPPAGYTPDGPLSEVVVDTESLPITDPIVRACLIVTKRVNTNSSTEKVSLYNKYYCNPAGYQDAFETWSSSKIFAVANGAGHLRSNESACRHGLYGLASATTGKHGQTLLADLATIICSYDTTAGYSSNSLSSYFHDLGFRDRIHNLVTNWLGYPTLSLGGNYGEATPSDLGFGISSDQAGVCAADKDPWPVTYSNSLTALAAAELTRRIALHRELPPALQFPGVLWEDIQNLLYGAKESIFFPGQLWGGMTADTAIFMQSSPSLTALLKDDSVNQANFRIFSKLGAGYSSSRSRGEIVSNAHLCLPRRAGGGDGLEITVTVEGSVPLDYELVQVEQHVTKAMQQIVDFALSLE